MADADWKENVRCDGVRATYDGVADRWIVYTPNGETITNCPCCSRPMQSFRAAQLVADKWAPMVQ